MAHLLPDSEQCCQPACDEVQSIQVPGAQGEEGTDGTDGVDGVNAYGVIGGSGFTMPAEGATVSNVIVTPSSLWMAVGQKVYVNTAGTFEVVATPSSTTVNLKNVENSGSGLYLDNVAPATVIAAGVKISPSGLQGPGGAGAAGQLLAANNLSDVNNAGTSRANLGLVIGTNVQAADADLTALAAVATAGMLARTGAGTAAARTITGTANRITVTNGDGVAGNPTISAPQDLHTAADVAFNSVAAATIFGAPGFDVIVTAPSSLTGDVFSILNGLLAKRVVTDKAANDTLTTAQTWGVFTNTGAAGAVTLTLPGAAQGLQFTFIVTVAQMLTIRAAAGDTVRVEGTASAAGGGIESNDVGAAVTLVAINSTDWIATSIMRLADWAFV